MFSFDKESFAKSIEGLKEREKEMRNIINPFLSGNISEKQGIELCHVGKFLHLLGESQILSHTDSPDFIILHKGEKIGLEHERIFVSNEVGRIKSISKLFNDAAKVFKEKYPEYKLLANCWLHTDDFKYSQTDKKKLINEIVEYINSLVTEKFDVEKPDFIERITTMNHSSVEFSYNSGAYFVEYLKPEILREAIIKKEDKVETYIKNSGINRQWLLIVIGSTSPDAYEFGDYPFTMNITSSFEKIFLMEDFNGKFWQLK